MSPAAVLVAALFLLSAVHPTEAAVGAWSSGGPQTVLFLTGSRAVAVDPLTPATVYVGTSEGVFKSADGGQSWTLSSTGLGGHGAHAVTRRGPRAAILER